MRRINLSGARCCGQELSRGVPPKATTRADRSVRAALRGAAERSSPCRSRSRPSPEPLRCRAMFALPLLLAALPQEPAAAPPPAPALLVIAPQPLLAALQPLLEQRRREGLRAEALALADALQTQGAD